LTVARVDAPALASAAVALQPLELSIGGTAWHKSSHQWPTASWRAKDGLTLLLADGQQYRVSRCLIDSVTRCLWIKKVIVTLVIRTTSTSS
jgi:hypothetical protein